MMTSAVGGKTLADHAHELYARYNSLKSSPHTLARLRSALSVFLEYLEIIRTSPPPMPCSCRTSTAFRRS